MPGAHESSTLLPAAASDAQLDAVVRGRAAMVRRALRQLGVPEAQLDDATQDVFVVLVRRIADFDRSRSLTNWLWGIAKGVASGYRRSGRRRGRLHAALAQAAESPSVLSRPGEVEARCGSAGRPTWAVPLPRDARSVERIVAERQAADVLEDFLGSLDEGKCAVFVLSELEGCSGPEIAKRLELNLNTVYARLRAARRSFREAMSGREIPGARPLFAGLIPSLPKPAVLASVAAVVATAIALPTPATDGIEAAPRLAGYLAIPDAAPPHARAASPDEPMLEPVAPRERLRVAGEREIADDGALAAALDYPFDRPPVLGTDPVGAGQGRGEGRDEAPAPGDPMLTTIALAAVIAGPAPARPQTDADADEAARVGDDGIDVYYEFGNDELLGDVLKDDGTIIPHRPKPRVPSLITLRGHFLPELMRMAGDV